MNKLAPPQDFDGNKMARYDPASSRPVLYVMKQEGGGSLYNDRAARSNRACAIRRDQSAVLISPDRA